MGYIIAACSGGCPYLEVSCFGQPATVLVRSHHNTIPAFVYNTLHSTYPVFYITFRIILTTTVYTVILYYGHSAPYRDTLTMAKILYGVWHRPLRRLSDWPAPSPHRLPPRNLWGFPAQPVISGPALRRLLLAGVFVMANQCD